MTPHNEAKKEDIAKIVLMPGDPLRAKYIAEKFLTDAKLVNTVRNMFAYTGLYKGKEVTVMASGMGMPSMGIYSYELYKFYYVENIIRVGTAGSYSLDLDLYDILLVSDSYSDSNFARVQNGTEERIIAADIELNNSIVESAKKLGKHVTLGRIYSTDVFYKDNDNFKELYSNYGCLACEMESFALFHNAKTLNKKAACILTISDSLVTHKETSSEERQNNFMDMIEIVLESLK